MSRCISLINPGLSIPELIKIVKYSFRESEFDEVQSILIDREKKMKIEIENLQNDHDSVKKEVRLLEKSLNLAESEKLNLEKKLRRKCKVLNDTITSLTTRIVEMGKEIEDLRKEKVELMRQNLEATKSLDELRSKKIESDKTVERYKIRIHNLEPRVTKVEGALANMLNVKVEDHATLAKIMDESDAAAEGETAGDRNFVHSSTKDDGANIARTSAGSQPGGNHPRVEPRVSVKMLGALAEDIIVICDGDDETNSNDTTYVSDTSLKNLTTKRKRRIGDEKENLDEKKNQVPLSTQDRIAPLNGVPMKPILDTDLQKSTLPSRSSCDDSQTQDMITDSEDESSCSDAHMNDLVATIQSKTLRRT